MVQTHRAPLGRKPSNFVVPRARKASLVAGRKISQSLAHHSTSRIRTRTAGLSRSNYIQSLLPTPPSTPPTAPVQLQVFQAPVRVNAPVPNGVTAAQLAQRMLHEQPRILCPPDDKFGVIHRESLTWIDPELDDMPLAFIRQSLEVEDCGPMMQRVCMGIRSKLPQSSVPETIEVQATNIESQMPTHMLAVFPHPSVRAPAVTIYPIHDIIFAAYCARWPRLPQSDPLPPVEVGEKFDLPVASINLPYPKAFPLLAHYLYTREEKIVMKNLLPLIPVAALRGLTAEQRNATEFGAVLARLYSMEALVAKAQQVIGFYHNLLALEILDGRLWQELCASWNITRHALMAKLATP
ncbi:hypothetical protein EIP91_005863 [Steccherinum ochraceum]|uniref:Uncharacterized protein n=1 Tax=Steccherinum ochraceum TaxID=92696 RepID=A0A4R0R977_9APHY|nr:hypothetical protein EIP91_005863 [Steccherinum ochraceum]